MESQQRPRKRRRKSHSRNIHRIILGLSLISVISICAVRLFYKNRSASPPDSDSDCMVMAADGNGSESYTPMENSMDTDLLQTLQDLTLLVSGSRINVKPPSCGIGRRPFPFTVPSCGKTDVQPIFAGNYKKTDIPI